MVVAGRLALPLFTLRVRDLQSLPIAAPVTLPKMARSLGASPNKLGFGDPAAQMARSVLF